LKICGLRVTKKRINEGNLALAVLSFSSTLLPSHQKKDFSRLALAKITSNRLEEEFLPEEKLLKE
jgi:hypothetical protein